MKYIHITLLMILVLSLVKPSYSQYSINYMSVTAGAIIGDGTTNVNYFGPNDYDNYGTCSGNWKWIHSLCSAAGNEDDLTSSTKVNKHSGSTWSAGGGASRYMVIDLGQARDFNELRVFQMWASDGKVTSVRMYSHPDLVNLPTYSHVDWSPIFAENSVSAGSVSGTTVSDPTVITFPYTNSRFVLIEAKNDGTHGSSDWTEVREVRLFNTNITLPIVLKSFDIEVTNNKVKIYWETVTEINNDFFTVERSINGKDWEIVNTIKGAGNSIEELTYHLEDNNSISGNSYYRLKQTDFDGNFEYFDSKHVYIESIGFKDTQIVIFPNPTKNIINIVDNINGIENYKIYSLLGKDITSKSNIVSQTENSIQINVSSFKRNSIYFVRIREKTLKFFIE